MNVYLVVAENHVHAFDSERSAWRHVRLFWGELATVWRVVEREQCYPNAPPENEGGDT